MEEIKVCELSKMAKVLGTERALEIAEAANRVVDQEEDRECACTTTPDRTCTTKEHAQRRLTHFMSKSINYLYEDYAKFRRAISSPDEEQLMKWHAIFRKYGETKMADVIAEEVLEKRCVK